MGINGLSLMINGFQSQWVSISNPEFQFRSQHFLRFLLVSHHIDARHNLNNRRPITTIVIDTFRLDNGFHIIDDWSEIEQELVS
jgi:hypothetical protein